MKKKHKNRYPHQQKRFCISKSYHNNDDDDDEEESIRIESSKVVITLNSNINSKIKFNSNIKHQHHQVNIIIKVDNNIH